MPFPIDAAEILKTETKLGVTFPPRFKARMIRNNGGDIEAGDDNWRLIPFFDATDRKRLSRTCNDIVRETGIMRSFEEFPQSAVVVAYNGGGDCLCLLPLDLHPGVLEEKIYRWDHETEEMSLLVMSIEECG